MAAPSVISIIASLVGSLIGSLGKKAVKKGGKKIAEKVVEKGVEKVAEKGVETAVTEGGKGIAKRLAGEGTAKALSNVQKVSSAAQRVASEGGISERKIGDVVTNLFKGKEGGALEKIFPGGIGGDNLASDFIINTVSNLAQQRPFTDNLRDDTFGQKLGNSLLGAVGQTVQQDRQRQFQNRELLMQMAQEINPAEEMFKEYQFSVNDQIKGFKDYIVELGMSKTGLNRGRYNAEDMLNIQNRYNQLQKDIGKHTQNLTELAKARDAIMKDDKGVWDKEYYNMAYQMLKETGQIPSEGFLKPRPLNADIYFKQLKEADGVYAQVPGQPYIKRSQLEPEHKEQLAIAEYLSNPALARDVNERLLPQWKQELSQSKEGQTLMQSLGDDNTLAEFMVGKVYGSQIFPDIVNETQRQSFLKDQQKESADKTPFRVIDNFTYDNGGQGNAIVFDSSKKTTVPSQFVKDLDGNQLMSSGDVVDITIDYIDNKGNLFATAAKVGGAQEIDPISGRVIQGADQGSKRVMIPANKAKDIIEKEYGVKWSDIEKTGVFKTEPNKTSQPFVYNKDLENKIGQFMQANKIKDRDQAIMILKQKGVL